MGQTQSSQCACAWEDCACSHESEESKANEAGLLNATKEMRGWWAAHGGKGGLAECSCSDGGTCQCGAGSAAQNAADASLSQLLANTTHQMSLWWAAGGHPIYHPVPVYHPPVVHYGGCHCHYAGCHCTHVVHYR